MRKTTNQMGLWGSLAILSGLGPEDPSSNLGSPAISESSYFRNHGAEK